MNVGTWRRRKLAHAAAIGAWAVLMSVSTAPRWIALPVVILCVLSTVLWLANVLPALDVAAVERAWRNAEEVLAVADALGLDA